MEQEHKDSIFVRQNPILKNGRVEKGETNYEKEWAMGRRNEKRTIIQRPKLNNH